VPEQDQDPKLLRQPIVAAVIVTVAVIAAAVLFWMRPWSRDSGTTAPTAGQPSATAVTAVTAGFDKRGRPTPGPLVFGTVLVNDNRAIELGRGTPVFVCLVLEPPPERTVAIAGADTVGPVVVSTAGSANPAIEWERLPSPAPLLAPDRPVTLVWIARTAIPAGRYSVTFTGGASLLKLVDAGLSAVRIEPGSLTIINRADDPRLTSHYQRRVLGLRGRTGELVATLESASKTDPSNLAIRRELVDALDQAGRAAEALHQLELLAAEIQDREIRTKPSIPPEMPDWVVFRLAELYQRANPAK
jgi:hypothetical protein